MISKLYDNHSIDLDIELWVEMDQDVRRFDLS